MVFKQMLATFFVLQQCVDKISGNGTCICQPNFKGTACEHCQESKSFGPFCNQSKLINLIFMYY